MFYPSLSASFLVRTQAFRPSGFLAGSRVAKPGNPPSKARTGRTDTATPGTPSVSERGTLNLNPQGLGLLGFEAFGFEVWCSGWGL